jgi:hypothetical protein
VAKVLGGHRCVDGCSTEQAGRQNQPRILASTRTRRALRLGQHDVAAPERHHQGDQQQVGHQHEQQPDPDALQLEVQRRLDPGGRARRVAARVYGAHVMKVGALQAEVEPGARDQQ